MATLTAELIAYRNNHTAIWTGSFYFIATFNAKIGSVWILTLTHGAFHFYALHY